MTAISDSPKQIKVLYVHHEGTVGGSSNSLRFLIQSLDPMLVRPLVLCPQGSAFDAFAKAGIEVTPILGVPNFAGTVSHPLRGKRYLTLPREWAKLKAGQNLRTHIENFQPDLVHLNESSLIQSAKIAKSMGIPVVMHARSVHHHANPRINKLLAARIDRYVDMLLPIDGSVKHSIRGVENSTIVYNPVASAASYGPHSNGKSSLSLDKSVFDSTSSTIRVTFLAGLRDSKGIWDLLEAAKMLKGQGITLQIAGSNARSSEYYRSVRGRVAKAAGVLPDFEEQMHKYIKENSLDGTIAMLGHVHNINELFYNTDILVFPSHLNGAGRSVFEAGIRGIPSVLALRDKVEDIVEHEKTGLIVPQSDPPALADAILRLSKDKALRETMGINAQEKYRTIFDPSRIAEQVSGIYCQVLEPTSHLMN